MDVGIFTPSNSTSHYYGLVIDIENDMYDDEENEDEYRLHTDDDNDSYSTEGANTGRLGNLSNNQDTSNKRNREDDQDGQSSKRTNTRHSGAAADNLDPAEPEVYTNNRTQEATDQELWARILIEPIIEITPTSDPVSGMVFSPFCNQIESEK